jgi:cytochrome c-type biogenesis protein CcmH
MKRTLWIFLIITLLALGWASRASAQQPTPAPDDVNRIARQLYCPVCENTPLDVCPTQACAQWRALIGDKLAAGWTDGQIKQYFVDQYGARVLAEPPIPLIYIVPPILLLIGVFILYRTLKSMRKPAATRAEPGASPTASDDQYLRRVEEELKKRN